MMRYNFNILDKRSNELSDEGRYKDAAKIYFFMGDDWIEKPSQDGTGIQWINPNNPNDRIRVMLGNPDSPNPWQQGPYVVDQNGGFRDVNGNSIPGAEPGKTRAAHIPANDFKFRK